MTNEKWNMTDDQYLFLVLCTSLNLSVL